MPFLIKPQSLKLGDTIGVVASSLPLFADWQADYAAGIATLRMLGFEVIEGATIQTRRWWSAGTPQEQAADINAMFANPAVRAIIALTGGFSALSVLDYLDYQLIAANPKPFLGMSDTTLYQWAMLSQCAQSGLHTNDLKDGFGHYWAKLAPEQHDRLTNLYRQLLLSSAALGPLPHLSEWECWRPGLTTGRLIGGNLKRLVALAGTRYWPEPAWFEGAIFFWEELGTTLYDLTIDLTRLKLLGVLDQISGMVIGKLIWINQYFGESATDPTPREAILAVLADYDFPILAEVDFGHNQAMLPLPIGIQATLNATNLHLELQEPAMLES
ncbi:S66 peptidase family protein [Herpetosiphon llansteffanensis]|uniref:S66 peptidase family protein n=1 Tax=Herpetosiphon llansteffanensis TaxID=2094568 RepID=UPI0013E02F82|nr:S66 peptidase family protein [Herpetosiphon llansteffanensis]